MTAPRGFWIEQDENGKEVAVVREQPERGIQLAGDGQAVGADVQARIDQATAALNGVTRGGPAPQPVTAEPITAAAESDAVNPPIASASVSQKRLK